MVYFHSRVHHGLIGANNVLRKAIFIMWCEADCNLAPVYYFLAVISFTCILKSTLEDPTNIVKGGFSL